MSPAGFQPKSDGFRSLIKRHRPLIHLVQMQWQYYRIWRIEHTCDKTCIKFIVVRILMELTVRQKLHFLYQCRYYLLLYSELCINNQPRINLLIIWCHRCIHANRIWWYWKSCKHIWISQSAYPNGLKHWIRLQKPSGMGSNTAGDIFFHFEFFAPCPFLTVWQRPYKSNQAWYSSIVLGAKREILLY